MLINNISDPTVSITVSILSNMMEILFRLTAYRRDFLAFRCLYGHAADEDMSDLHAVVMNLETIMEVLSIIASPFLMFFFQSYAFAFSWYGGPMNPAQLFGMAAAQLVLEAITDVICFRYEGRKFDVIGTWQRIRTKPFLAFILYGYISMGCLGMVYVCLRVPRGLFCSDMHNFCSCIFASAFCCSDSQSFCL